MMKWKICLSLLILSQCVSDQMTLSCKVSSNRFICKDSSGTCFLADSNFIPVSSSLVSIASLNEGVYLAEEVKKNSLLLNLLVKLIPLDINIVKW